jgi:hypothetical protein
LLFSAVLPFFFNHIPKQGHIDLACSSIYERKKKVKQQKITINAITLDSYCKEHNVNEIDLICMDVEGSELDVLKGSVNMLKNIKYIITEMWSENDKLPGSCDKNDITSFLLEHNFEEIVYSGKEWGDSLFKNKNF